MECRLSLEYINNFLEQNTADWINVGSKRIPTNEDVIKYGNIMYNNFYWISYSANNKDNNDMYYVNSTNKLVETDKIYNMHDLVPIIVILKDKVK